jgi:hypothetical protein
MYYMAKIGNPIELIILGSGSSSGTPRPICILDPNSKCEVCRDAISRPQCDSKNWRGNPAMMLRVTHNDGRIRNLVGYYFLFPML